MFNRRSFLGSILAAGMAPAIVKADNLMKIVVPRQDLILPDLAIDLGSPQGDFTIEAFMDLGKIDEFRITRASRYHGTFKPPTFERAWSHVALVQTAGIVKAYINGSESKIGQPHIEMVKAQLRDRWPPS